MATFDINLSIRVAVIRILGDIENHFPLEKEKLCFLLFDEEARVRRAVSSFVKSVWEEEVDEKLCKPSEKDKGRIGIKTLGELLVKWAKALDSRSGDVAESELGDEDTEVGESSNGKRASEGESHVGPARGRPRVNGKSKDDFHVDESWRLEEAEETA